MINSMETGWRFKIHERTISEVLGRYGHNRQFNNNIILMFDYLVRSCMLLWNRSHSFHIFLNYNPNYSEVHYRHTPANLPNEDNPEVSPYERLEFQSFDDVKRLAKTLRGYAERSIDHHRQIPMVRILRNQEKKAFLSSESIKKIKLCKDLIDISDPIILIIDEGDANLGCIVLYGFCKENQASEPFGDDASSNSALINWSRIFSRYLCRQAGITNETYLPSYRRRHSTPAAILFGDITNFTQLATMLRIIESNQSTRKVEQLCEVMQKHCCEMSKIISEHRGRIERFIGDGLMAIFGEHQEHPIIAVGNAIAAATKMVTNVRQRRQEIQDLIYGEAGQNEINEMIEIDYSVGINYGTVLFDYLGDDQHREYSCIGYHVAFADRLMHKAARFDPDTRDKWPPILISQTAEQHFKFWLGRQLWEKRRNDAQRILHARGYGYPSYVYGFDTDLFDIEKYERLIHKVWEREKNEHEIVESLKSIY